MKFNCEIHGAVEAEPDSSAVVMCPQCRINALQKYLDDTYEEEAERKFSQLSEEDKVAQLLRFGTKVEWLKSFPIDTCEHGAPKKVAVANMIRDLKKKIE